MPFKKYIYVIILLFISSVSYSGVLTLSAENDAFSPDNTDKFYTHGTRISYSESIQENNPFAFSDSLLVGKDGIMEYSIGQYMYTPDDISIKELQIGERPYAGVLYLELAQIKYDEKQYSRIGYVLGITGKYSYAEEAQTYIHEEINNQIPMGWENQIGDEPIINIQYTYKRKLDNLKWLDFMPKTSLAFGNAHIFAELGLDFIIGYNLPKWPSSTMEPLPREESVLKTISIYLIGSLEERLVARNITLDGNTFKDSYHVDKNNDVFEYGFGIGVKYNDLAAEYKWNYRSKEFDGQNGDYEFGTICLKITF